MTESGGDAAVPEQIPEYAAVPPAPEQRAYRSAGAWARFLIPAALGLGLDLWVKAWAFPAGVTGTVLRFNGEAFDMVGRNPLWIQTDFGPVENPPATLIPNVLGLHTTINYGAVFGILQGMVVYFLLFSFVAMVVILWVFAGSKKDQWVVHLALGMITAGALGNLYDRAMFNGVRDMFQFYVRWYPYIFNVADVLLCIGVPLLMLRWSLGKR